jgi:hypothetical protein
VGFHGEQWAKKSPLGASGLARWRLGRTVPRTIRRHDPWVTTYAFL